MNDHEDYTAFKKPLDDYIEYFEKLNVRSIRLLEKLAEPGMRFKDPFNDVRGIDAVERILQHMFQTLHNPKFKVRDYAWGRWQKEAQGAIAYLRWDMTFEFKGQKHMIEGMSEVMFSKDGKVMSHIDHWDAGEQFYEHIPILGSVIRFVKSKLKIE